MTGDHTLDDLELLAYADGLLDADATRKSEVEERLQRCPALAERARAFQAQTEALRRAYNGRMYEAVPDRLLAAMKSHPRPRGWGWARATALILLVATTSVSAWLIGRSERGVEWSPQRFLQHSYQAYLDSANGVQTARHASAEPLGWLSQEISLTLRVPDLADRGYAIVDKRTVNDGRHRMVRIVYQAPDGHSFSLFLRPRWDERRSRLQIETGRDVSVAYWLDGPLASAIASNLSPEETRAIAETVRDVLLDPDASRPTIRIQHPSQSPSAGALATGARPIGKDTRPELPKGPAVPAVPLLDTPG